MEAWLSTNVLEKAVFGLAGGWLFLFFVFIWLWIELRRIKRNQITLFTGKQAINLEAVVLRQAAGLETLDKEVQELFDISNRLHQLGASSIHKVGFIRFNPFKEVGSNQSFSIALLDGSGSGFVLSSLLTREGCRVYAKPIQNGEARGFPLTDEEIEAVAKAQNSAHKQNIKSKKERE